MVPEKSLVLDFLDGFSCCGELTRLAKPAIEPADLGKGVARKVRVSKEMQCYSTFQRSEESPSSTK